MMMGYDNMVSEPPAPLSACAQEAMATTETHDARVQQMLQQLLARMEAASPSTPVPTADTTMDTNLVSARRVFEEMPGHQEANTGRGLRVMVSQVFYPVTEKVLHQVFDAYGAEKVCDLEVADRTKALVLFRSSHDAVRARDACHGRCIYDNCCWLDLQYVQPLPTNSTPVMPGKCLMPCLSHDAEKPKAASTPVVASTMPLATSVAMDTTSFAQIKTQQPGACMVFVGMPRKTESEAKYHRFVKWVSRVRITRRPVHWAMRSKHGSSGCEVKVSDVKEDNAAQGDVLDTELKHTIKLDIKQPTKVFDEITSKAGVMEGKTSELSLWEEARCLCGVGKFDKAFQIIKEMTRKGFVPDTSTYSKVITFLCQAKKVEKAFLLFQEMKKAGVNPVVYTYTILIDSFCKAGLIEQAQSWFDEMRSVSCSPNVVTYTALLHAYLKAKQLLLANDIFHRMVDAGCRPNGITYSALIDGLCKSDTIAPNVVTYGALIDGLCKAHKVADAHELLDAMLSAGCEPNHIVYDALIDGFCKVGKIDNAQEVFLQMIKCGCLPSVHTYTSLIDRMFKDGFHSDILKSTNNIDQDNIIGCGGFGLVYKATLPDGATIAIKRLLGDFGQMKCEFKAEVETLLKAQHPNLVLLQCYCRIGSDKLLIYSYMENGSLDHWLHEKSDGPSRLSWKRRLQIAKGAARGLAYLHLSCRPNILHCDIKSSNILLDEKFEAHLADCIESARVANHVQASQPSQLGFVADPIGDVTAVKLKNGRVLEADIVVVGQISSCSVPVHDNHLQVLWDPGGIEFICLHLITAA